MKKFFIVLCMLAALISLSPAALADSASQEMPVSFEGSILEVIAAEATDEDAATAEPVGCAPVAENMELETYRGVSVGGRLGAADPDSDTLYYEITTQPIKGTVTLSPDGYFVYTPEEGKRGRDYFAYCVTDGEGNRSQDATVIIKLNRQHSQVFYSDLEGDGCAYSAAVLAENGIFVGQQLGDCWVFSPDTDVSRGEFLSMCMVLQGEELVQGVLSTGFTDDGDIDSWLKPYISTALMQGYISDSGSGDFKSAECITLGDAAQILNDVLAVSDVAAAGSESQALENLAACGILSADSQCDSPVSRRDAANMLAAALEVLNRR